MPNENWNDHEYEVVVKKYCEMWKAQKAGNEILIEKVVAACVAELNGSRSSGSVRMRFQNISSVFEHYGKTPVSGITKLDNITDDCRELIWRIASKELETGSVSSLYDTVVNDLSSEAAESDYTDTEGRCVKRLVNIYERNPKLRAKAIKIHDVTCSVCGFSFEEVYGDRGKNYIDVHHTVPLSEAKEEKDVTPKTDLVPVCANCHRMIHRYKENVLSVDDMKKILNKSNRFAQC
jgi:predicted HNH restriction endonuclease